jgi:4-diphosphocytidyl-2-C-methyl-D-erythritol kinase
VARYPEIGKLADALKRSGARHAAMTGSGSTVFGLFATKTSAEAAADWLVARTSDLRAAVVVTRTLSRAEHERRTRPTLARK